MKLQSLRAAQPRRAVLAGVIAALFATLPLSAGAQSTPAATAAAGPLDFYSVINVGPQSAWPLLNERGQVAYTLFNMIQATSGFFDGERARPIGALGGGYTSVRGLNNQGVVAGIAETSNAPGVPHAFTWTPAAGARALSGASHSAAFGINDSGESVGWAAVSSTAARAIRWNPNGSATPLGPLTGSAAQEVNKGGYAAGFAPGTDGAPYVALWDRAGAETSLGSVGSGGYYELRLNDRNEVAGLSDDGAGGRMQGFLWRRDTGRVPIDAGEYNRLEDLNNRGEVVGGAEIGGLYTAFYWASGRGVLPLPRGAGETSVAVDINERGEMTGALQRPDAPGAWRAVRWPSFAAPPIDLNARLYRAPAGLQLTWALRINDRGEIVADSNAGLVLLRPGQNGTAAPVLGPVAGIPATINPGQDLTLTVGFIDSSRTETHKASAVWTDGCASPAPTVTEAGGVGQVRLQHRFCALGNQNVKVTVTDSGGRATELRQEFVVYGQSLAGGAPPRR